MCTLILLNYNDVYTVEKYLHQIKEYKCFDHVIIVDNCSTDGSFKRLLSYSNDRISVIESEVNKGYGYGNNFGIKYATEMFKSEYILISNPDVVYDEETILKMETLLRNNKSAGVVGTMMKMKDGSYSNLSAWRIPTFWQAVFINASHPNKIAMIVGKRTYDDILKSTEIVREVDCIPGSLLMVNRHCMEECGMYDEGIFLYGEETVLGIRMKRCGYKTLLITDDFFIHYHSVSINKSIKKEADRMRVMWTSRKYILEKYYDMSLVKHLLINIYSEINIRSIAKKVIKKNIRKGQYYED